jgi:membrane associated rhomboid family serine protease
MMEGSTTVEERNGRLQPIFNIPGVVKGLLAILVAIHMVRWLAGDNIYIWSEAVFSFIPAQVTGNRQESLPGAAVWSFLSYAFLHGNWPHLLFNCLWLAVFGSVVARRLGAARFLLLSAFSAVAGAAAMLASYWGEAVPVVGASAAISGQMAAAVPLMYGSNAGPSVAMRSDLSFVPALSPKRLLTDRRPLIFMIIWLAITLLTGATGMVGGDGENINIAWQAHIGGFIAGLIAFYAFDQGPIV